MHKFTLFLENYPELKQSSDGNIYVDALDHLGAALIDVGRCSEAIGPLEEALSFAAGEQRRSLCFDLGYCHFKYKRWQDAEEKLIQSLPGDPKDPRWQEAQFYLGVCHLETGKLKAAEELIRSMPVDRRERRWARAQYELGRVYFGPGAYLRAKEAFEFSEFFVDGPEQRENISRWFAATRAKLGERVQPNA